MTVSSKTERHLNRLPPIHPGEVLSQEFLLPMHITQHKLAQAVGVDVSQIHAIIRGEHSISAETALLFSRFFGNSAEFWMGLQSQYDLEMTEDRLSERLGMVSAHSPVHSNCSGRETMTVRDYSALCQSPSTFDAAEQGWTESEAMKDEARTALAIGVIVHVEETLAARRHRSLEHAQPWIQAGTLRTDTRAVPLRHDAPYRLAQSHPCRSRPCAGSILCVGSERAPESRLK